MKITVAKIIEIIEAANVAADEMVFRKPGVDARKCGLLLVAKSFLVSELEKCQTEIELPDDISRAVAPFLESQSKSAGSPA